MNNCPSLHDEINNTFDPAANIFIVIAPDVNGTMTVKIQTPAEYAYKFKKVINDVLENLSVLASKHNQ